MYQERNDAQGCFHPHGRRINLAVSKPRMVLNRKLPGNSVANGRTIPMDSHCESLGNASASQSSDGSGGSG